MRVSLFRTFLFFSLSEFALAGLCNKDNCLHAMNNHASSASAFCTPYLATTQTATTGIPSFLSHCKASTSRLSSACSCILTSTANTATSPTSPTTPTTQLSCTATTTITALASTVTKTVTSGSTCPSTGTTSTVISVSIFTTTATVTAKITPTCFPHITGGDFTSNSQNLAAFNVTENPGESIFVEVLAPSAQEFLSVTDGTPQFLYVNYLLVPIPTTFTLAQDVGPVCAPYTSLTLSATINAELDGGIVTFCINSTTCSSPQSIPASNGKFVGYSASFVVPPGAAVTASLNLAANYLPQYFAGIGAFEVSPS